MRRKLRLVKDRDSQPAPRAALVYGMRLIDAQQIASIEDAQVKLADGTTSRVTMHIIEGSHLQIRRQLIQSIDAFFELFEEE
ncbi:MAG: allantoinase [Candidatus Binataceae bacterium]|nr:allantoinase [Candidatus Binataceae bacterium]